MASKRKFYYRCIVVSNESYDPKWGDGAKNFSFVQRVNERLLKILNDDKCVFKGNITHLKDPSKDEMNDMLWELETELEKERED